MSYWRWSGGVFGCLLAHYLLQLFVAIALEGIPRLNQASLDWRVLLFAVAISLISGFVFGLAPALARTETQSLIRTTGRLGSRGGFRQVLVATQIAISLVLLTSAGLLLRSLWNLMNVPLGMRTSNVLTASLVLGQQRYSQPAQQQAFFEQLETRLQGLPGVEALAISDSLPPAGATRTMIYSVIDVEGRPPAAEGTGGMVIWRAVTPGYFSVLGVPIVRGRGFEKGDLNPSENAVILSSALSGRLFQGEEAIGRRIRPGRSGNWLTVVGIAGNVLNAGLNASSDPEYYIPRKRVVPSAPAEQSLSGISRRASLILRSPMDPEGISKWIRSEVAALDSTLPVTLETMPQRVGQLAARHAIQCLAVESVLGFRAMSFGIWTLWRDGFSGGPAHSRDWRADGFGCNSRDHCQAGTLRGCPVDAGWGGVWSPGLVVCQSVVELVAVPGFRPGSAKRRSNTVGAPCRHARGGVDSFAAGSKGRSNGGSEVRVKP